MIYRRAGAHISACGNFRYWLTREWGGGPKLVFIMLNPSTADANVDDNTVRKCVRFAQRLGFDGIVIMNLYAYRTASPKVLADSKWLIGDDNDGWLQRAASSGNTHTFVAAWGTHAQPERAAHVTNIFKQAGVKLHALKINSDGTPAHPLYLREDSPLLEYA